MSTTFNSSVKTKPALRESLDGDCLWIDVRTPAEFRELHVPGSVNVPLGDLERLLPKIKEDAAGKHVGLVCASGRRASVAFEQLIKAGVDNCWVLEGGVTAWAGAGHPVNRGRKAISLERQVRIMAGSLVVLGSALGAFVHPGFCGLAAFIGAGLAYSGVTDTCGMALMLAKLPFNRTGSQGCCGDK